jgi:MOSC domain-containing protein
MAGRIVRISIAPVKALHLVNPEEVELTRTGVTGDRRFWLVDGNGRLVNDKSRPQLLRVRAEWDEAARRLGLEFPGGRLVEGVVEPGEPVEATMYGQPHPSRAVPGPWHEAVGLRRRAAHAALVGAWCRRPRSRRRRGDHRVAWLARAAP